MKKILSCLIALLMFSIPFAGCADSNAKQDADTDNTKVTADDYETDYNSGSGSSGSGSGSGKSSSNDNLGNDNYADDFMQDVEDGMKKAGYDYDNDGKISDNEFNDAINAQ